MPDAPPQCDVCHVPMETGILIDHGYGVTVPQAWVPGTAQSRWSRWAGLKIKRPEKMPVTTYRCPQCGRLASFALPGKWPA